MLQPTWSHFIQWLCVHQRRMWHDSHTGALWHFLPSFINFCFIFTGHTWKLCFYWCVYIWNRNVEITPALLFLCQDASGFYWKQRINDYSLYASTFVCLCQIDILSSLCIVSDVYIFIHTHTAHVNINTQSNLFIAVGAWLNLYLYSTFHIKLKCVFVC